MKTGWLVTAKWTQVAPHGWAARQIFDSSNPLTQTFVLVTVECETGHEAIERTKKHGFCFKGIEGQFAFQAFKVALLDDGQTPSLPLQSLESATVEMGDGRAVAAAG